MHHIWASHCPMLYVALFLRLRSVAGCPSRHWTAPVVDACQQVYPWLFFPGEFMNGYAKTLLTVCRRVQPNMSTSLSQCSLPAARRQWRAAFGSAAPRRSTGSSQMGNALGGRPSLAAAQRQQQRRLAGAAAAAQAVSTAAPEAAAASTSAPCPTSQQRKELPKNFDPAAREEARYKWGVARML